MTIYILEIKNRFILLFITWLSTILVGYFYKEILLFLFLESEMFLHNEIKIEYFIYTDIIEVFSVYIQLIFFISFQILVLYILYHSFIFISFGLYFMEYFYLYNIIKTFLPIFKILVL
jgi:Sec-independent protein secretion pathway component TatC